MHTEQGAGWVHACRPRTGGSQRQAYKFSLVRLRTWVTSLPPLTSTRVPVMYPAASLARNVSRSGNVLRALPVTQRQVSSSRSWSTGALLAKPFITIVTMPEALTVTS